ncbi:hypothetical protein O3M35_006838 [Rhynocoris fuscipes]|uniref:Uncharacterized protein n=1 Tax=Rhynocoris fuscipes TaxID=488301 RepID=A0AAW1DES6_9HEMI
MVEGETAYTSSSSFSKSASSWTPETRKTGFEALKKYDRMKTGSQQQSKDRYGAWGPIFKNKDHFLNLHIC